MWLIRDEVRNLQRISKWKTIANEGSNKRNNEDTKCLEISQYCIHCRKSFLSSDDFSVSSSWDVIRLQMRTMVSRIIQRITVAECCEGSVEHTGNKAVLYKISFSEAKEITREQIRRFSRMDKRKHIFRGQEEFSTSDTLRAGALSWQSIESWFHHHFCRFLRISYSDVAKPPGITLVSHLVWKENFATEKPL